MSITLQRYLQLFEVLKNSPNLPVKDGSRFALVHKTERELTDTANLWPTLYKKLHSSGEIPQKPVNSAINHLVSDISANNRKAEVKPSLVASLCSVLTSVASFSSDEASQLAPKFAAWLISQATSSKRGTLNLKKLFTLCTKAHLGVCGWWESASSWSLPVAARLEIQLKESEWILFSPQYYTIGGEPDRQLDLYLGDGFDWSHKIRVIPSFALHSLNCLIADSLQIDDKEGSTHPFIRYSHALSDLAKAHSEGDSVWRDHYTFPSERAYRYFVKPSGRHSLNSDTKLVYQKDDFSFEFDFGIPTALDLYAIAPQIKAIIPRKVGAAYIKKQVFDPTDVSYCGTVQFPENARLLNELKESLRNLQLV